jgi:hypothetical protein
MEIMLGLHWNRLLIARSCFLTQGTFLSNWRCKNFPHELEADISRLRDKFPSLFVITLDLPTKLCTEDVGRFFAILGKLSVALSVYLLQNPSPRQLERYCADLTAFVRFAYPNLRLHDVSLVELASLLKDMIQQRRAAHPDFVEAEAVVLPLDTPDALAGAFLLNVPVTARFLEVLLAAHFPAWWECLSFRRFFQVSKSFAEEYHNDFEPPYPELTEAHALLTSDLGQNLKPVGECIPLGEFCQSTQDVPPNSTCSVCITEMLQSDSEAEKPVVTECHHFFHEACLDAWVNGSCMNMSGHCPSCRSRMCRTRERSHKLQTQGGIAERD